MNNKMKNNKKILVGLSGGVDSSVTVRLLQEAGFNVEGIFLEFWKSSKADDAFKSAKKVAKTLGISLIKVNAVEEFKKVVVDKFIEEYKRGNTPNPCILCNPQMKFKVLLKEMKKRNADLVATGHYVRNEKQKTKSKKLFNYKLFRAKDKTKDQSYFLYGLSQKQLSKIIFPLGNYLKTEVKKLAEKFQLSTARRAESQDVCFITQKNFGDFLKKYIKNEKGKIVDEQGNTLGQHIGLHFYTIGQRKGINLGGDGPYYVVKKNLKDNELIVSNNEKNLYSSKFLIKNSNWIALNLEFPLNANVKVRYHGDFVYATIRPVEGRKELYIVELSEPQKAVTIGQSAVFYSEDGGVFGGGIIKKIIQ